MSKKITMPARPKKQPIGDDWVEKKVLPKEPVKLTRISLDVEPEVHRELKIHCTKKDKQMAELLRELVQKELATSQ